MYRSKTILVLSASTLEMDTNGGRAPRVSIGTPNLVSASTSSQISPCIIFSRNLSLLYASVVILVHIEQPCVLESPIDSNVQYALTLCVLTVVGLGAADLQPWDAHGSRRPVASPWVSISGTHFRSRSSSSFTEALRRFWTP